MNVHLEKCNNIESGDIEIVNNQLNIKYAINGTGKSTISKAIELSIKDRLNETDSLRALLPYRYTNQPDIHPLVSGVESINSIMIFDDKYLSDCTFQPDELLKGSFDVFIKDASYDEGLREIEQLTEVIQNTFIENDEIEELLNDFKELSESFGRPVSNGIHGASKITKALGSGNKIVNVPIGLEEYEEFIQHDSNFKWIKWQIEGNIYSPISEKCPYCVSNIGERRQNLNKISEEYKPKDIENLNKIVAVFSRLDRYFSDSTKERINLFLTSIEGYTEDEIEFLLEIKRQIDALFKKFFKAKFLNFGTLKDVETVLDELREYRIDISLFSHLYSESTSGKADSVNASIDLIIEKASILQGKVNRQKILIGRLVEENKKQIDDFLKNAGFSYCVDLVEDESGEHKLKLRPKGIENEVSNVKDRLSFGEKNAFALVLFMFDCLKKEPDLIILDDPISSFDNNKKYAIVDMLFQRGRSFRRKTVLMMTHDFEPIVDIILHHSDRFDSKNAKFLENQNGTMIEKNITKDEIQTFFKINKDNILNAEHLINKIIYLRRLVEVADDKGLIFQIISSLIHKDEYPKIINSEGTRLMTSEEYNNAQVLVSNYISDFSYDRLRDIIVNDEMMITIYQQSESNYEKLHIHRIIFDDKQEIIDSAVIKKFINETFHIESNYIYQLNPRSFQTVPQFVVDVCDTMVHELSELN